MSLVVFTGLCGLLAAPVALPPVLGFTAILCIALGAGAAGALNQWYEADLDAKMRRTANRPLPARRMDRQTALHFGVGLVGFLGHPDGPRGQPSGGAAAGGLDPVLRAGLHGLAQAADGAEHRHRRRSRRLPAADRLGRGDRDITLLPVLLFAIIFLWTPPHFWALSLFVRSDYAKAGVPMLPVVAGVENTRRQIFLYSLAAGRGRRSRHGRSAWPGASTASRRPSSARVRRAVPRWSLANRPTSRAGWSPEKRLFAFSILYLFALFAALVVDRWMLA